MIILTLCLPLRNGLEPFQKSSRIFQNYVLELFQICSRTFMGQMQNVKWDNFLFYKCSSQGQKICSRKVPENSKSFSQNSSRTNQVCSRTVPEQIFRTFMEQLQNTPHKMSHLTFYKCLGIVLEHLQNGSRTIPEMFQLFVLELFQN